MESQELATALKLRAHVDRLAGEIGERNVFRPEALQAAAEYIERQWRRQGYAVERLGYELSGARCFNLEITRRGAARNDQILLIGAHYDTVPGSPGANDNGSGVAALIELSRLFAGLELPMTVRFVAFVNEEPPFFATELQGSMVYAQMARRRGDDIRLMVCLETMGCYSDKLGSQGYPPLFKFFYPDRANFIGFVSNLRSWSPMRRLAAAFRRASDFPLQTTAMFPFIPGVSWSDHRSFWVQGFRAVMVTDTAFYRYPHYHAASDTPNRLDYSSLSRVTLGLHSALAELADIGFE
jgi:Zn-dependent M28 family amino/carboxypeptidase